MEEILSVPENLDGIVWHYKWASRLALWPMHHHAELEVNVVVDGTATYVMNMRRYDLTPGSIVWLFPNQDHLLLQQSPDYVMWIAVFKPALIGSLCSGNDTWPLRQADPAGHFCRRLNAERTGWLAMLFRELLDAIPNETYFNVGLGFALLAAWSGYQSADDLGEGHDIHPAVEQAARLVHNSAEPLGLTEIARRVGLSPTHLCRLFKLQMGLSLVAFRNGQCIDRFVRLYAHGRRRTMIDAAMEAGFGSYTQFYRVFTKHMGCTPGRYRQTLSLARDSVRG